MRVPEPENIFNHIPTSLPQELIETIVAVPGCRIERIVSQGHASPAGFWYDQPDEEWVIVLRGCAGLLFEGEERPHILRVGDHIKIPARCRHRVAWTDPRWNTMWLAVHYTTAAPPGTNAVNEQ
jgi:cupin 2 domain-containing protein